MHIYIHIHIYIYISCVCILHNSYCSFIRLHIHRYLQVCYSLAKHHLAIMLITVLVVLSLTIATTTVSGNDCECEYDLAHNNFHGDQKCFTAYYTIKQDWRNLIINNAATYSDTLCNGNCGAALNRILYYSDRVYINTREVSTALLTILHVIHNDICLTM